MTNGRYGVIYLFRAYVLIRFNESKKINLCPATRVRIIISQVFIFTRLLLSMQNKRYYYLLFVRVYLRVVPSTMGIDEIKNKQCG